MTRPSAIPSGPISTRTIHTPSQLGSTSTSMSPSNNAPGRAFLNPVAVFDDRFCFTTLDKADIAKHQRVPFIHPTTKIPCHLFTLDDQMVYSPFAKDFGPLNLAFTFAACLAIHDKITAKELKGRPICLYTTVEPKQKSNMALIAALYCLIVRHQEPWECFMPIASFELVSFRDAGNGVFDHGLCIQDILYGMHKATEYGLCDLTAFDPRIYQYHETPENGDLNVIGPFIAFASPIELGWSKLAASRRKAVEEAKTAGEGTPIFRPTLKARLSGNHAFRTVLEVFKKEQVGLVVRLNDELYDKRHFTDANIRHIEMYFDDGSNPSDDIVREFIAEAERYIAAGKAVAVHCKAGLGRTGVLIGAYLIYKYSFSAQEVIGFMRVVRPGMVVGPQQQYILLNQMKWAGWAARNEVLREISEQTAKQINPLATPPSESEALLPKIDLPPVFRPSQTRQDRSPKRGDAVGQPRKALPALPDQIIEIHSPTPEPEDMPAAPPPSSQSSAKDGSTRGIKRGATRLPIPSAPSTPPRLGLDIQHAIERSPSILSVASANDRPRKRVTGSPLAVGLTSPPPSRQSSPDDGIMAIDAPIQSQSQPMRIPNKLEREISMPRLRPDSSATRSAGAVLATSPTRSLLPNRAAPSAGEPRTAPRLAPASSPTRALREINAIQASESFASPSRIPRAIRTEDRTKADKETRVPKEGWTPPRLMSMLYGKSRS